MSETNERELTETRHELLDHELDTVTGGLVVNATMPLIALAVSTAHPQTPPRWRPGTAC